MAETIVNENSDTFHTVGFVSSTGGAETPASVTYTLYDAYDGTVLVSTSVSGPSTSVLITIPGATNAIRHALRYERRMLTVTSIDGLGHRQVQQFSYLVKNLGFVQSTST